VHGTVQFSSWQGWPVTWASPGVMALWEDARIELGPGDNRIEIELLAPATDDRTSSEAR